MEFILDEKQTKQFLEWNDKHKKECKLYGKDGAIGGRLTFSFTPNGLGVIEKVTCACG